MFTGTVTGTTYDVPNLSEGTQVVITVTAISSNGCPNTTGTVTCKATACPNAKITFPNKVITQCLTPTLPLIPLPYTIANNLPNEVPTVAWSSSNPLTNSAINNAVNPATFNPQIAKEGIHTLVLTYQQKDCIWKDSILGVPCASEYEVFINGVSKGKQTGLTYTASGLVEGEMVELQIKSTSTCECPIPTVMTTCTAKACPTVVLKLTPSQTSICLTATVTKIKVEVSVTGNTPDGKGTWSGTGVDRMAILIQ
ncbi:MAG: hypothetical protein IPJ39_05575 [Saprospiraceae bacterium]|nr:hypothetical protein [Saprospiraceae bacterium]